MARARKNPKWEIRKEWKCECVRVEETLREQGEEY